MACWATSHDASAQSFDCEMLTKSSMSLISCRRRAAFLDGDDLHPRNVAFAKLPPRPEVPLALRLRPASQATPGGAIRRSGLDSVGLSCNIELRTPARAKTTGIFRIA